MYLHIQFCGQEVIDSRGQNILKSHFYGWATVSVSGKLKIGYIK